MDQIDELVLGTVKFLVLASGLMLGAFGVMRLLQ